MRAGLCFVSNRKIEIGEFSILTHRKPFNLNESYLRDHFHRSHNRNTPYLDLRSTLSPLRNIHLADHTPVLDFRNEDSGLRVFWILAETLLLLLCLLKRHVSGTVIPKADRRAHRLFPFHRDRACCRSVQRVLGFRHLDPGALWFLWLCLL